MAKINFGKQSGDSKLSLDVVTHSSSQTEINAGDQLDRSTRDVHITDLPDIDMSQLALDLARLRTAPGAAGNENLKHAEAAAAAGDRSATKQFLMKAGAWALNLATTVGAPVAIEAIKHSLGLK